MSKVTFRALGGANSVGGSCYVISFDGYSVMVDCGSVTRGANPNLRSVDSVQALFGTHGHLDHIGLVPLFHKRFPEAPIFMNFATLRIGRCNWADVLKIATLNGLPASFEKEDVMAAENHIRRYVSRVVAGTAIHLADELQATPYHAGHILGAVAWDFEYRGNHYVFTGDISLNDHQSVPGANIPRMKNVRAVFCDSTYAGIEPVSDRKVIKSNLVGAVNKICAAGGQVVITTLSIDRMQEAFITLHEAKIDKRYPVWVAGGTVPTEIYMQHAPDAKELVHMQRFGFGKEGWEKYNEVRDSEDPMVILASSGMAVPGSPSYDWVLRSLEKPQDGVFFINYQDPNMPGARILRAEPGEMVEFEDGQCLQRSCYVEQFDLSTHAKADEIRRLMEILNPETVVHVHGQDKRIERFMAEQKGQGPQRIKSVVGQEIAL